MFVRVKVLLQSQDRPSQNFSRKIVLLSLFTVLTCVQVTSCQGTLCNYCRPETSVDVVIKLSSCIDIGEKTLRMAGNQKTVPPACSTIQKLFNVRYVPLTG